MFSSRKIDQLRAMYILFNKVPTAVQHIINKFNPFIEAEGRKIVNDEGLIKDPVKFTEKLLELKDEMDKMIESAFNDDMKFQKARDDSF